MGNAGSKTEEGLQSFKDATNEIGKSIYKYASSFGTLVSVVSNVPTKPMGINDDMRKLAEQMYSRLDVSQVNIAFIGPPGCGKASLINGLLQHTNAATEDVINPTQYYTTDPVMSHVRLWDLPTTYGDGHPSPFYYYAACLYVFDMIIFVETDKIRAGDVELAKQASLSNPSTPSAFVKSQMDDLLNNQMGSTTDRQQWETLKQRVADDVRISLRNQLDASGLHKTPFYLISRAGVFDVNGKVPNDYKYVVDELNFFDFILKNIKDRRY